MGQERRSKSSIKGRNNFPGWDELQLIRVLIAAHFLDPRLARAHPYRDLPPDEHCQRLAHLIDALRPPLQPQTHESEAPRISDGGYPIRFVAGAAKPGSEHRQP